MPYVTAKDLPAAVTFGFRRNRRFVYRDYLLLLAEDPADSPGSSTHQDAPWQPADGDRQSVGAAPSSRVPLVSVSAAAARLASPTGPVAMDVPPSRDGHLGPHLSPGFWVWLSALMGCKTGPESNRCEKATSPAARRLKRNRTVQPPRISACSDPRDPAARRKHRARATAGGRSAGALPRASPSPGSGAARPGAVPEQPGAAGRDRARRHRQRVDVDRDILACFRSAEACMPGVGPSSPNIATPIPRQAPCAGWRPPYPLAVPSRRPGRQWADTAAPPTARRRGWAGRSPSARSPRAGGRRRPGTRRVGRRRRRGGAAPSGPRRAGWRQAPAATGSGTSPAGRCGRSRPAPTPRGGGC